eukprot:TRINITY_DN29056_c0_g2_i1.p2 TRINITY_DN29056_c0_g2~~TRINITY_DN29056_c0_g2_i1.p2  ORF type:complete len:123 (+),score=48.70 TRINITY_DN29056_c0_g2_i1:215-583(+)
MKMVNEHEEAKNSERKKAWEAFRAECRAHGDTKNELQTTKNMLEIARENEDMAHNIASGKVEAENEVAALKKQCHKLEINVDKLTTDVAEAHLRMGRNWAMLEEDSEQEDEDGGDDYVCAPL